MRGVGMRPLRTIKIFFTGKGRLPSRATAMAKHQTAEHEDEESAHLRSPRFIFKKYNAVVQSAELLEIRLTLSKFDVKSEYYLLKHKEADADKSHAKLGMGGALLESNYVKQEGLTFGNFEWFASSTKGRKRLLSIKSRYLVVYAVAKDLEDAYVQAFLANVGKFATFPYFRSLVATYNAAASADLPILPVLRQPINTVPDEEKPQA
jgi:hypothetical protein